MEGYVFLKEFNCWVNDFGIIKKSDGETLNPFISGGYLVIKIKLNVENGIKAYKTFKVHRLVAIAFVPNPENKKCVDHIDGDKLNPKSDNLRWCSRSENNKFGNQKRNPTIYKVKRISKNGQETIFTDILEACLYSWQKYVILQCCNGKRKTYNGFKWELI